MTKRTKLIPYQKEGVLGIEASGWRTLLADDMGLGKTIQALYAHRRNRHTWPCVVVCPAAVKHDWEQEAATHVGVRAQVLSSRNPPRGRITAKTANLYIINYDILPKWVAWLRRAGIKSVIIDESHFIQNGTTIRTTAIRRLCRGVDYVLCLSGTPLTNRPRELFPTLHLLWPEKFPSWKKFARRYCDPQLRRWGWTFDGARRLPELHKLLKSAGMIRRLKEDVSGNLPTKTIHVKTIPIARRHEYREASSNFLGWLRRLSPRKARRAAKAKFVTRVGYLQRLTTKLKLKYVARWVEEFLKRTDEKIVIYFTHTKAIDAMSRHFAGRCITIDGRTSPRDRRLAIEKFRHSKRHRVLLANIIAAGTGVNGIQHAASTVVFAELDPRPGIHEQAADRLHRIGQMKGNVDVLYLIAEDTIEDKFCNLLQLKSKNIRRILDGRRSGKVLDIMDRLMEELKSVT